MTGCTFVCAICGEELPTSLLSKDSLEKAGTRTRVMAAAVLDPEYLICSICSVEDEPRDESRLPGRNDVERFEFSGLTIDPAKLQAYYLNN